METAYATLGAAVLLNVGLTFRDYFQSWPDIPSVQFIWQTDFLAIARWLDARPAVQEVTVSGLSNLSMDSATMDLLLRRADVRVRWMDTGSPLSNGGALVVPERGGWLLVPDIIPLDARLEAQLAVWEATSMPLPHFRAFEIPRGALPGARAAVFEGNLLLGTVYLPVEPVAPGESVTLMSVWQAQAGGHPPLKIFVHLVDAQGALVVQHDGLDSPAQFWQPGDGIVQLHPLKLPEGLTAGAYGVRVGLYDRDTLAPYPLTDGRPFFEAGTLAVQP